MVAARIDIASLHADAISDEQARLVLADLEEEHGRMSVAAVLRDPIKGPRAVHAVGHEDAMRIWCNELPARSLPARKRIDSMTKAEKALQQKWAEQWIKIGLSTERADRVLFEAGVAACYRLSGQTHQPHVVWAPAPIVVAYAGPIALHVARNVFGRTGASVDDSVRDSVDASVDDSVRASVRDSVHASVGAGSKADLSEWWRIFGGQFWVGGWGWGNAYVKFMLDALGLDIGREQELKARAYAATAMSACWWFPATKFVLVSERPALIEKHANDTLKRARWEWLDANGPQSWEVAP